MLNCSCTKWETVRDAAKSGYDFARDKMLVLKSKFILSEVCILKMMLVSFGVLLGTLFSDFFKKYRKFVIITFIISVGLFIWKVFQAMSEWDEY